MENINFDDIVTGEEIPNRAGWRKTDFEAIRTLLAANMITDWYCVLHENCDYRFIPADNPMREGPYEDWKKGSSNDSLICDMSCPGVLADVLDILPSDTALEVCYWKTDDGYPTPANSQCTVWIRPTYENIAEMGAGKFFYLCNSAG